MRRSMGFMGLQQTLDYPSPPPLGQSAPQCATLIKISLLGPSVIEHNVGVLFFPPTLVAIFRPLFLFTRFAMVVTFVTSIGACHLLGVCTGL